MRFMALVYFEPGAMDHLTPEDVRLLDDATIRHDRKLRDSGHLIFASPLAQAETARSLRTVDGALIATDGPFSEGKEVVGGFLLLEAESLEALMPLFEDDPILQYGRMEIRPLVEHTHSETGEGRPDFALS
ncbi:YciI family protein [Devosia aurantiaca]|uniref:YciI family protein n=1 Tax=Devosia aurantiaca TaxID=2714858 RepID=A0A6M1SUW4_9HYPH|nr:YciI family protein [Devosia aurantiaca]NGP18173.1 YciI family protein [Devosia aurantiaca]